MVGLLALVVAVWRCFVFCMGCAGLETIEEACNRGCFTGLLAAGKQQSVETLLLCWIVRRRIRWIAPTACGVWLPCCHDEHHSCHNC